MIPEKRILIVIAVLWKTKTLQKSIYHIMQDARLANEIFQQKLALIAHNNRHMGTVFASLKEKKAAKHLM